MTRRARILVVDDEPGMIRAVERVLGDAHQVVGSVSSGNAVLVAAELKPELAILDIRMPELDGFELMARLKAGSPQLDVILMTGSIDDMDDKLIRAIRSPAFYFIQKPFDREVLKTLVDRCLELRWIREQHRHHLDRLETEMAEARAFQQSLLPDPETIVNRLAISCRYTPCSGLGGDLYDYAAGDSGQTALLIADVSGHGVSAAMLTGVVKSAFYASRVDGYEPLAVVHRVWSGVAAFGPERFVTLFAALVAPDEGRLRYVNAGHPSSILWGERRAIPFGWRAQVRSSRPCCPCRNGKSRRCRLMRRINFCFTQMASLKCSRTPTAVQTRRLRLRSNAGPRVARCCWTRFSPRCTRTWRDALSPMMLRC